MSDSVRPHRRQPTRLPRPWDSPGKNTGVGCHFLLQRMKVKSESEVVQSCPTLSDPMDCSLPGSSIHGIFQARILEWGAIAFSGKILILHINTQTPLGSLYTKQSTQNKPPPNLNPSKPLDLTSRSKKKKKCQREKHMPLRAWGLPWWLRW